MAKFSVGERVKVMRLLDNFTSRGLIGMVGTVEEIEVLPNGQMNYYVDGHYMHEEELEKLENIEREEASRAALLRERIIEQLEEHTPNTLGNLEAALKRGLEAIEAEKEENWPF